MANCYPEIFNDSNNYYVLMNQDDFGKNKETLYGKIINLLNNN